MARVEAVISDFGGVLTSPLADSFAAFSESLGHVAGGARHARWRRSRRARGVNPLFELETGRLTEAEFLGCDRRRS